MTILLAVVLFVPGIVVGCTLWRRLSRPSESEGYLVVAAAVSVSGFFALLFLAMFVLTSFDLSNRCADIDDYECYVVDVAEAFRWWYLGLFAVSGALAYLGMKYCNHIASGKQAATPKQR